jgi:hypothetical protein
VPAESPAYRRSLAASTLALDLGGANPALPAQSTDWAVPCIGLSRQADQVWLWPDLSLERADPMAAAVLARWMLTDQGDAAAVCMHARQQLADRATSAIEGVVDGPATRNVR